MKIVCTRMEEEKNVMVIRSGREWVLRNLMGVSIVDLAVSKSFNSQKILVKPTFFTTVPFETRHTPKKDNIVLLHLILLKFYYQVEHF